jgi:hypothetical protein
VNGKSRASTRSRPATLPSDRDATSKLREPRTPAFGAIPGELTATALTLSKGLTLEEWMQVGATLERMGGGVLWWTGDWLLYNDGKWGEQYLEAAKQSGYSYGTLRSAKWVTKQFELSRRRDKLTWAHHQEVARMEPAEQDDWLDLAEANKWTKAQLRTAIQRKKIEASEPPVPPGLIELRTCSAVDLLASIPQRSVDLVLTDPPYSSEFEMNFDAFAEEWFPWVFSVLKLTGRAYVCIGAYPQELLTYLTIMDRCLGVLANEAAGPWQSQVLVWEYRNTLGPAPSHDYKLNWQAVLYIRGPEAPPLNCPEMIEQFSVIEINAPDGRQGDRYHAWQKPKELAERFIRHAAKPGDLVVDPFAGTGTFLRVAAQLGRRALGTEPAPGMREISRERGVA